MSDRPHDPRDGYQVIAALLEHNSDAGSRAALAIAIVEHEYFSSAHEHGEFLKHESAAQR